MKNIINIPEALLPYQEGKVLLIDKPVNWTSFDVVGKLRNCFKPLKLKIGHAGTLDPLATGLLIICTGKLTKKIDEYQAQEKEYTGTFVLGATTPSYDLETEVNQNFETSHISKEMILDIAKSFLGEQEQIAPAHSALKINGERAYEKARRGEEVEIKSRTVNILDIEITNINMPMVDFRVRCSKGTYIRSLANDFGKRLNSGAYLTNLRRTAIGNFSINDASNMEDAINSIISLKKDC